MAEHTKGPWEAEEPRGQWGWLVFGGDRRLKRIARVESESAEDARLIAVAPELLEALSEAVDYMYANPAHDNGGIDWREDKRRCEIIARAEAAIAKAREGGR